MKIAICDDEKIYRDEIESNIREIKCDLTESIEVELFDSGESLFDAACESFSALLNRDKTVTYFYKVI